MVNLRRKRIRKKFCVSITKITLYTVTALTETIAIIATRKRTSIQERSNSLAEQLNPSRKRRLRRRVRLEPDVLEVKTLKKEKNKMKLKEMKKMSTNGVHPWD